MQGIRDEQAVVLYPAYLDAGKSHTGGRRVSQQHAVVRPDVREMYDAITKGLNLVASIEVNKRYSRDWLTPGRLRVQLKNADGTPANPTISTKAELLRQCATLCGRHADRPRRLEEIQKMESLIFSGGAPTPHVSNRGGSSASTTTSVKAQGKSNKKKGKKK